eukprot:gb/GFBE01036351.1/.p1 GENE.gb/GFBE01036351.1/~~gb/GFBE01036351.1/.p1  ORF type:complete len:158 (+),score=24.14 gb/GFBE01036351.1/:1-474(+)
MLCPDPRMPSQSASELLAPDAGADDKYEEWHNVSDPAKSQGGRASRASTPSTRRGSSSEAAQTDEDYEAPQRSYAFPAGHDEWKGAMETLQLLGLVRHNADGWHGAQIAQQGKDEDEDESDAEPPRSWAMIPGNPRFNETMRIVPPNPTRRWAWNAS